MSDLAAETRITAGTEVLVDGQRYVIKRFIDLASVLAVKEDGERVRLSVTSILRALTPPDDSDANDDEGAITSSGFEALSPEAWETAQRRASILAPLVDANRPNNAMVQVAAEALGVHRATIYRWVKALKASGAIADLAPRPPGGGRGKTRTDPLAEAIITELIDEKYLTTQRPRVSRLMRDIQMRCRRAGIKPPHPNTVRRRIAARCPSARSPNAASVASWLTTASRPGLASFRARTGRMQSGRSITRHWTCCWSMTCIAGTSGARG